MLEYTKTILNKVAFDRSLFEKELRKSHGKLMHDELSELYRWCTVRFGRKYGRIIHKTFANVGSAEQSAA